MQAGGVAGEVEIRLRKLRVRRTDWPLRWLNQKQLSALPNPGVASPPKTPTTKHSLVSLSTTPVLNSTSYRAAATSVDTFAIATVSNYSRRRGADPFSSEYRVARKTHRSHLTSSSTTISKTCQSSVPRNRPRINLGPSLAALLRLLAACSDRLNSSSSSSSSLRLQQAYLAASNRSLKADPSFKTLLRLRMRVHPYLEAARARNNNNNQTNRSVYSVVWCSQLPSSRQDSQAR